MMNAEPIYDLRERLRAAAMAGTNLLSEDFRLKRAYEAFKPLETASPVFAKVGQLTEQLLTPDCQNVQGALLDTITLADAVICTLGKVDVSGEIESPGTINAEENTGSVMINAPYSALKGLLEALTTSGGGHYGYICDTHENKPELFRDYRVRHVMVQALGASYAELADQIEQWMIEDNDKTILPVLYQDFDPKGKKEMVRRVNVISALAGAGANDFYVKMLDEAQKDVRTALIDALRHERGNLSLLFDLSKTEKGKNKDKVFELLAEIQDERVNDFFKELAKKKPETVLIYLKYTTTEWSAELVADICGKMLGQLDMIGSISDKEKRELSDKLQIALRALFGKGGARICECYRKLLAQKEKLNGLFKETWQKPKNVYEEHQDILLYGVLSADRYWLRYKTEERDVETALGKILHHTLIVNPDSNLQALAMELVQNVKFLPAAVTVKISNDEDCSDWLEEQVTDKALLVPKFSKARMKAVAEAAVYVRWDGKKHSYELNGSFINVSYPECKSIERSIKLSHAKGIMEWLMKHSSKDVDDILARWVPFNDEEMCKMMGEYFYKKALITGDNHEYLSNMKACGWTTCKGLGVKFVKDKKPVSARILGSWMVSSLPGDHEAIIEEARTICEMIRSGELKVNNWKVEDFESYMDGWSR
ncbi:MAG: hypothetical protein K2N44_03835 [Lachnospiraceae bacterium]|nr:hypothetical protein [Lachnospiraceae bacterium]